MLPAATIRALLNPAFAAAEFAPTQWASAEDKAKFANALMKFIANEFPRRSFTKPFYGCLSNTFGHIAHGSLDGFYGAFFEGDLDEVVFLEQTLSWPHFGDPTFPPTSSARSNADYTRRRRSTSSVCSRPTPPAGVSSRRSPACKKNTERGPRHPIPRPLARSRLRPPLQDDRLAE